MKKDIRHLTTGAMIAALYAVITLISHILGLDSGMVQIRLSEALTVLPVFTPAAIPGLFVGCMLANLLSGCAVWDIVFGSVATLLGAIGTRLFAKKRHRLAPVFPIITNTVIVPIILKTVYGLENAYILICAAVFAGELISCGILGLMLGRLVSKTNIFK